MKPFVSFLICCLASLRAFALPIAVDPTGAAFVGTFAVEWNTAANFESWMTTQVTGAAVSGGVLSGTTNGTDPQVRRSNFAGGPDLDLGFNDFIELRMQVPASFAGNIEIYYGTTATTGFGGTRVITIPNATIPKDGAFHVYRVDAGPEPWWRATLRDLRVDTGSVAGVAFAIDYLRVGDLPGDVYLPNTTDQPVTAYELSSKHFRFIWDANRVTNSGINATVARGCLRNAEEAWQTFVKLLGYREPAETMDLPARNGSKYKVNFLCTFEGYWMGGSPTSFGYFNIDPSGLQVDPPTWIIPHELMHVFQMHNSSGHVPGEWWETHANYGRERWLYHYANHYPSTSNLDALAVRDSHFMMSSGRNYYLTWLPFLYIDENPDALPDLYDGMVAKMWQETQPGEFPMMALDRLTPTTSLKDIVGYYARRGATFDYAQQATLNTTLSEQDSTRNARHIFTDLVQRADDPTWWRVPQEKAPAQGAYAIHQLVPAGSGAGRVVTVNLHGLGDAARGADWRASFIAVSDTGVERYTPLWSAGSSSITLAANENTLYLSVAGTPDVFHYGGHDEALYPFRSHPSRSRFYYEVQVTGATPRERNNGSTAGLVQHANGGGYKASTASVAATAYVGPNARVLGSAVVSNTARIEDYAVVRDFAQLRNNAVVSGHALVRDFAVVQDFARVRDWAIVDGGTISGNARVLEHATVAASMQDTAVAKGSALHQSGGTLSGNAIVDGDYMFNKSLSGGVTIGHLPFVGIPDNFTTATPTGLYAAYDFGTAHDSRALDKYGITDAFTVGSPAWTFTDAKRKGFLTFNGSSQYIALDRSVGDSRAFTFAAWVKPSGGPANQAVLWLGASPTRRLFFTPSSTGGQAQFSIVNGGAEQTLTAATALPLGVWSHVAVTLDGTTGVLYVDGSVAASGPVTIRPDELLAANTATGIQHNYLARAEGSAMPMFQGSLNDAQFFSSALSAAQISAATVQPVSGDVLLSDNFNSESYGASAFNSTLAADQQGVLAPTAYTVATGGQDWHAQHGNGAGILLVGDAGFGSRASLNQDFALAANSLNQPLSFQFDATVSDTANGECWASITIGSGQNIIANSSGAKFAILPKINGGMEVWVNGSQAPLASHSGNNYRIILSNTAGTGSAFNGNGSKAGLYNGATLVGTYTLPQLAAGDGYLSFGANPYNGSFNIARFDNLSISRVFALTWKGSVSSDFNTASNYVENEWREWTDYLFNVNATTGIVNVDALNGWGNISLNSGLTTDILIQGTQPISMYPGASSGGGGGTIILAPDSRDLTIATDIFAANPQVWNIGTGRTLTIHGVVQNWTGQPHIASLNKQGAGTAILTAANTYTGGTNISAGTLVAAHVGAIPTSGTVAISTSSGAGTLRLATDTSVNTFPIGTSSSFSGTIIADRATPGAAVTHTLGAASLGRNTYNFQPGSNVTSGTARVSLTSVNVGGGGTGTTILNPTDANLSIVGAVNIGANNFAKTLNLGGTSAGNVISGVISNGLNTLSLIKSGPSIWTLSGANTLTGPTTIEAGTLAVNGSHTGSITVASGATLAGSGSISATTTVNGLHSPGATAVAILTHSGALNYSATSRLGWQLNTHINSGGSGTAYDRVTAAAVTVNAGAAIDLTFNAPGSVVNFTDAFWDTARTWNIITHSSGTGTFALGTVTTDIGGRASNLYGRFSLTHSASSVALTWTPGTPLENWRYQYFGTTANTGTAANDFDADGDGEVNLMEFSTGQSPLINTLTAPTLVKNGAMLEFTYTRSLAALADSVTFTVEWRDSLTTGAWSSAGVTEQILSDNGTVQTIRASVSAGAGSRFLHLKVSKP